MIEITLQLLGLVYLIQIIIKAVKMGNTYGKLLVGAYKASGSRKDYMLWIMEDVFRKKTEKKE